MNHSNYSTKLRYNLKMAPEGSHNDRCSGQIVEEIYCEGYLQFCQLHVTPDLDNNNNNNNPICKAPECQKTSVAILDGVKVKPV